MYKERTLRVKACWKYMTETMRLTNLRTVIATVVVSELVAPVRTVKSNTSVSRSRRLPLQVTARSLSHSLTCVMRWPEAHTYW
jgi:hypothetical protein